MIPPAPLPAPRELIDLEVAGYRALLCLLDAERDALRRVDADAIESTAGAKQQQIAALERLARTREAVMRDAGYPATAAGAHLWLRTAGPDRDGGFAALLDLARAAREANLRNSRLMQRQRRHYEGAFAALLRAAGQPALYGADGRTQNAPPGRPLAAA